MKPFAIILMLTLLCGCSGFNGAHDFTPNQIQDVPPSPTTAAILPVKELAVQPQVVFTPPVQQVTTNKFTFIYPPDMTNYNWQLQDSADLFNWNTQPTVYYGLPSTNSNVWFTNTDMQHFYRMIGTHI